MSLIQRFSPGDVVENRYHLDIRVHEGRWGDIYRATDRINDRPVAIRFFPVADDGPADFDRFTAHARELSGLTAPSIAVPVDHGMEREVPYLVFRWANGQNLQDRLGERGPLGFDQALTVIDKLLHGLSQAHDSHLTHGLIRPVKIVIDDLDGETPFVKLVDFQIWRFYQWSSGKEPFAQENLSRRIVRYTAPEVLDEQRVKPVTDLYAAGLVIIEMLTGQPALDDNHRIALIARQMSDEVAELDSGHRAGTAFREFLSQLVAKDPSERFPDATQALAQFRDQKETFLSEPGPTETEEEQEVVDDGPGDEPGEIENDDAFLGNNDSFLENDDFLEEDEALFSPEDDEKEPLSELLDSQESTPVSRSSSQEQDAIDPDTELFEGNPAGMRSLSDGSSFDEEEDELFDDGDEFFESNADFGDFYSDEEPISEDIPLQTNATPGLQDLDEDDDEDPTIANDVPVSRGPERIHAAEPMAGPSSSRKPGSDSGSDISMGTYVAIVFAMMAVMAGGVYFIAFHDSGTDAAVESNESDATDELEDIAESEPIRIDTIPPSITVVVEGASGQLIEGRSRLEFSDYTADDFPLTISARRGDSETSVVLDEYTDEVLIELEN